MVKRLSLGVLLVLTSVAAVGAVVPGAPQNLSAVVTGDTVTLTWQAPAMGGAPVSYVIEASLSPGGALIASISVAATSAVVTAVPNGVYYVRVRGLNADGLGSPSNEIVVSVPSVAGPCNSPPNAPVNFSHTVAGSVVTLNWLAPPGPCVPTLYVIQAGSSPGLADLAVINAGVATTLSVAAPPGTYYVRVLAVNAFGASAASNERVITVSPPLVPNLTGVWSGTSNYFNAPFEFDLVQTGNAVSGTYQDQHDFGFVSGNVNGTNVLLDVYFGDTGIRYEGTVETADRIRGTIRGSVIGGVYNFEMTR